MDAFVHATLVVCSSPAPRRDAALSVLADCDGHLAGMWAHGGVSCGHGRFSNALQSSISVAVMDCHGPEGVSGSMVVIHRCVSDSSMKEAGRLGRKPSHIVGACDTSTATLCSSVCACMRLQ